MYWKKDICKVLMTAEEINEMVKGLGEQITKDYEGKDLLVVGILKGSAMFMVDLVKYIDLPLTMDFMVVSSYGNMSATSGEVKILKDVTAKMENKHVLIVEDIVDSGLTLSKLKEVLKLRNPASLKVVAAFDKPEGRRVEMECDYSGTVVPNEFVVGYGLDYAEKYRNIPELCVLKPEIYE